ncbi:MAG: TonB-dependent receptor [Chitinophagaceae bacterium]|nr:MAG: TonB-dependent receptor [Chitinophagaceae bacterium]
MKLLPLLLLSTISFAASAQNATLSGSVLDRNSQKPLAGVTITLQPGGAGTSTDTLGAFVLAGIPAGTYTVTATGVGYTPRSYPNTVLNAGNIQTLAIELEQASTELANVTISSRRNTARVATLETPLSAQRLTTEDIRANPGGNFDISRVIQSLPGVGGGAGGGTYRNDIIIRGGAPSENVFYLDGIEVPVINHFSTQGSGGGPQGILNVSFIDEVKLSTSAFDARYDNALSSVFQFRQKPGNSERLQGNFRLSGTEAAATLDGPLSKKTTFLASARRSYLTFLFKLLDLPIRPDYWDFQFKTTTRINNKTTLTLLGIGAIDEFRFAVPEEATPEKLYTINSNPLINQWTYTGGATLRHLTARGYWNIALSRNALDNRLDKWEDNERPATTAQTLRVRSRETENKLRFDVSTQRAGWKVTWGVSAQLVEFDNFYYQLFRPRVTDGSGNVVQSEQVLTTQTGNDFLRYGAFVQAGRKLLNDRLGFSAGLRADANTADNSESNPLRQLSPRISLSYALNERWNLSASYGLYYRLPSYTQLAFGAGANPGRYIQSTHYVAGLEYLPSSNTRFTLEGFHKGYRNYPVSIPDGISLANKGSGYGTVGNEPVRQDGRGEAYGIEFFAQQKLTKRFFGVFSYTLYRSLFTNADGSYAPASWDNRHLVSFTAGYKARRNWEFGLKFRYQGAAPYTPYDLEASRRNYPTLGTGLFDYTNVNSTRLPAFSAADLRIDKKWNFRRLTLDLFLDVQNFYGAENTGVPEYTFRRSPDNRSFYTTDGAPLRSDGSNAEPLLLENKSGTVLPTIGIIVEF